MRSAGQDTIAIGRSFVTLSSQEEGVGGATQGPLGSTRVGQEADREAKTWARAFIVVSAGRNGQDRASGLGMASWNNFFRA